MCEQIGNVSNMQNWKRFKFRRMMRLRLSGLKNIQFGYDFLPGFTLFINDYNEKE